MADSTTTASSGALTVAEVQAIIKKLKGYENGNEVYPNIFVGDAIFIRTKEALKALGITHVLNAVEGNQPHQLDTNESFYSDVDIRYMGVPCVDFRPFNLAPYFRPAADFIHKALQDGGKVAVDCFLGVGPSFSLVLAYMLLYKDLPLMDAIETIGWKRQMWPNDGYVQQLIDLDNKLRPTRSKPQMSDAAESTTTSSSGAVTVAEVQVKIRVVNRYNCYNESYPNIFVGDKSFIMNKETLKTLGITHVLNAAEGKEWFLVDTNEAFYSDVDIRYMGVPAADSKDFSMTPYFRPAADYIHKALQDGGKVGVNCLGGASRSNTLVLAYLMIYEALPLVDAIRTIGAKRALGPNDGFVQELIDFENELKTTRNN